MVLSGAKKQRPTVERGRAHLPILLLAYDASPPLQNQFVLPLKAISLTDKHVIFSQVVPM